MDILFRILSIFIGYAFGCLQFAYFIGKFAGNIDIREHGSGNAGMTNVTRTMGLKFGGAVFILDIMKAMAAFFVATLVFGNVGDMFSGTAVFGIYAGLGAILGHNFPFFMKFRGGKGVSCTAGVIIAFDWRVALVLFVISLATLIITRYISVVSLTIAVAFPLVMVIYHFFFNFANYRLETIMLAIIIGALCWIKHKDNIIRLVNGTERKVKSKKEPAKGKGKK